MHLHYKHSTFVWFWPSEAEHLQCGQASMEGEASPIAQLISDRLPSEGIGDVLQATGASDRLDGEAIREVVIGASA
jgi:hypothetical protein